MHEFYHQMDIVFATGNQHKIKEAIKILPPSISLLNLSSIGCDDELPETGSTLRSNASQKARYVSDKFGVNCFSDDSGLEVIALDGRPGVYSARFAGQHANAEMNNEKLLAEMNGITDRRAIFHTVISLILNGEERLFEGLINGTITLKPIGENGFGYDPLFIPEGYDKTFAQMEEDEKNALSHRAIAMNKLAEYLKTL